VIVVDNASDDNTVAEVRRRVSVRLVVNPVNRGFAAAVNQGFETLMTDAVLILNPDTVVGPGLSHLERAISSDPSVGAVAGKLLDRNGFRQDGFNVRAFPTPATLIFELIGINRIWPSNPVNRRYRLRLDSEDVIEVDQPAGAFLMVRHSAWREIGGFDEAFYPVWFEDVDFCKRLRDRGFRSLYVPAATAMHTGAESVSRLPWEVRQQVWYGSLLRYASKHYPKSARRAVAAAVVFGCIARAIVRCITEFSLKPFTACTGVIRLASLCLRRSDLTGMSKLYVPPQRSVSRGS
jgi:GT2 family glycosyltransferase